MYFGGGNSKKSGKAFTDVTENLVNANTLPVNNSKLAGSTKPTLPLPSDAVEIPSWSAVDEAEQAASGNGGSSGDGSGSSSSYPTPAKDKDDKKDDEDRAWLQANQGTAAVCYPKNGYEVVKMINGTESPCRVIVLTKPFTYGYKIQRQINVSMPKVCEWLCDVE
jgi:hypothetical protein